MFFIGSTSGENPNNTTTSIVAVVVAVAVVALLIILLVVVWIRKFRWDETYISDCKTFQNTYLTDRQDIVKVSVKVNKILLQSMMHKGLITILACVIKISDQLTCLCILWKIVTALPWHTSIKTFSTKGE